MKSFIYWLKSKLPIWNASGKIKKGHEKFKVGYCKVPTQLKSMPTLSAFIGKNFTAPRTVDLRDYCTKTENQGQMPWCAAYTAAGWAENILWRKNDVIQQVDPAMIYREAKKIDGDPHGDGTTLDAVLQILLNKRYFDPYTCKIQVIWNTHGYNTAIKYAIHKFGACLLACNITEEWYLCGPNKTSITGTKYNNPVGGHAILCCGYNEDGVIIQNSWGEEWGAYGFALITWEALSRQFLYAAVLSNCLNNMQMN